MNPERYIQDNDGLKYIIRIIEIKNDSIIYAVSKVTMIGDKILDKQPLSSIIIFSDGSLYSDILNNHFFNTGEFKLVTNEINILVDKTKEYFNEQNA